MAEASAIEWTDATWNPVRGCTKISPGCKHCYAETFAERFRGVKGHPYEQGFDLRLVPEKLGEPLRWRVPKMIIEIAPFVLENNQSVFAVSEQKVEKGCLRIGRVGQHQIEGARIATRTRVNKRRAVSTSSSPFRCGS